MQFHHGSKLKKIIEKSPFTIVQVVEQSGVSRGTLYNFFDYEELSRKKIAPILKLLDYDIDAFFNIKQITNDVNEDRPEYGLKAEIEALKKEIELLYQQVADKDEIISLLKSKRK